MAALEVFRKTLEENCEDEVCCKTPEIIRGQEFKVCRNCGTVVDKIISDSGAFLYTTDDIRKKKSNEPIYYPVGPRTFLDSDIDSTGNYLNYSKQKRFQRLGKINRSLTTSLERNLWIALPVINKIKVRFDLSQPLIDDTIRIYKAATKKRMAMGRSIEILVVASLHVAMKLHKNPRVVDEILDFFNLQKKSVMKCYRQIVLEVLDELNIKIKSINPKEYINQFCSSMALPIKILSESLRLYYLLKNSGFQTTGKDPKGIAAACIYVILKRNKIIKTQKYISDHSYITEITLRARYREISIFITKMHK